MLTKEDRILIRQQMRSHKHEVFIVSFEEMDSIVKSSSKRNIPRVQNAWDKIKWFADKGANYGASADDIRTLSKLVGDLGGAGTTAYIKNYGGKPHIILKGNPRLRTILTGTKYGVQNPKVVTIGLGRAGAIHAAKTGGILSIILITAYRVLDYFLTDQSTLNQLIGSLATDIIKIGIATGASIAAASFVVGLGITIAIGPIVAVLVVGIISSVFLGQMDTHFHITERVIKGLDELSDTANSHIADAKKELNNFANDVTDSVIDYAVDCAQKIIINIALHNINKFMFKQPRVY